MKHPYHEPLTVILARRKLHLVLERQAALRWMWINNIKERKHELLRRS